MRLGYGFHVGWVWVDFELPMGYPQHALRIVDNIESVFVTGVFPHSFFIEHLPHVMNSKL
jgi:hypothetical protein